MKASETIPNFIGGQWTHAQGAELLDVENPATREVLARVPLSGRAEIDRAVARGRDAFTVWRRTPVTERIQYLFKLKQLLEDNVDHIARTITLECGKTFVEAKAELRRGIENVEVACGMPMMIQGYVNEDIAEGIDEFMIRQPLGVVAAITPFNFPAMIPLWFLPYAVACGNSFLLKPSERVPMTMRELALLIEKTGLPAGVVQIVNGGKETVEAIVSHPGISAVSFVGSSAVARYVYSESTKNGKRAQCQGGAKNPVIVLPDADMEMTTQIVADSAFGCAGQRCLAASIAVAVGDAKKTFVDAIVAAAQARRVGFGLEQNVQMGPVISPASKSRIESMIEKGVGEGAQLVVDGRNVSVPGYERGNFMKPTILGGVDPKSELANTEIFGPVLTLINVDDVDAAINVVNAINYGNMACLFTNSGAAARKFRYEARAGNIGINLGVAAPMAFFPFTGWRGSFFGDLHAQGRDAVEFYTDKKVVVERWPKDWSRRF
jgi:malonate-semialdehyde dehydrogenase (acetylating) / methylmalonate-semialdehyde dehydrogenase